MENNMSWLIDNLTETNSYAVTKFIYRSQLHGVKTLIRKYYYECNQYHWSFEDGGLFKEEQQAEIEKWYKEIHLRKKKLQRIVSSEEMVTILNKIK